MSRSRARNQPLVAGPQLISAAVALGVAVAYLILIDRQDHGLTARPVFIAALIVVLAGLLVWGARATGVHLKAALLAGASNSLILLGFLGLFSIGVPLLIAGIVSLPATARALAQTPRPWGPVIVALVSAAGVAVIVTGILATA